MTTPSVADRLNELRRAVARSRAAIAEGSPIELRGLDAEVALIADAARNASPAERPSLLTALDALRQDLDGLEIDLRRQHDAALAQQAAGAYGAAQGNT